MEKWEVLVWQVDLIRRKTNILFDKYHNIYIVPEFLGVSFTYRECIYYGTVYKYPHIINLFHEILHLYLPHDKVSHAIIELITNGELVKNLYKINEESIYKSGHWFLSEVKEKIMFQWIEFINDNDKNKNIYSFIKKISESEKENIDKEYMYRFTDKTISIEGYKNSVIISEENGVIMSLDNQLYNELKYGIYENKFKTMSIDDRKHISDLINKYFVEKSLTYYNPCIDNIPKTQYFIQTLAIEIINVCNYKCQHCYFYNLDYRTIRKEIKILSLTNIEKAIDFLRFYGLNTVNILGGEPFCCDITYIEKLLDLLNSKDYIQEINIFTNLSLMNEDLLNLLLKYKTKLHIKITIHSSDCKTNDMISGYVGDLKNKKYWIPLIRQKGIKVSANTIITKNNSFQDIDKIENLWKKITSNEKEKVVCSLARVSHSIKNILDSEIDCSRFMINPFENLKNYYPNIDFLLSRKSKNSCWSSSLALDYNGNVYTCAEQHSDSTCIGNIKELYNQHQKFIKKYDRLLTVCDYENKCKICEFRLFCYRCTSILKNKKIYNLKSVCKYNPITGNLEEA